MVIYNIEISRTLKVLQILFHILQKKHLLKTHKNKRKITQEAQFYQENIQNLIVFRW